MIIRDIPIDERANILYTVRENHIYPFTLAHTQKRSFTVAIRFDFSVDLTKKQPQLAYIVYDTCAYQFEPRLVSHRVTELHYIVSGKGKALINNTVYDLDAHRMYTVAPGVPHGEFVKKGDRFSYYILGISDFPLPETVTPPHVPRAADADSPLGDGIRRLYEECLRKENGYLTCAEHYFQILITLLYRTYGLIDSVAPPVLLDPMIKQAKKLLDENFGGNISSQIVADMLHVKQNTLGKKFKKATGMSVQQYILYKRIENAKLCLQNDTSTVTELAINSGFYNQAYFCKYFKKLVGMTPTAYRNMFLPTK